MEETLRQHLLSIASAFEAGTGISMASIGRRALNDNTVLQRLSEGQGFTVKTYDRLVGWFSDQWPDGVEWPADVPRPAISREVA